MQDETKRKALYDNLSKRDGYTGSYEKFKVEKLGEKQSSSESDSFYNHWLVAPSESKLKEIYIYLLAKNPEIKDNGFEGFANDMKDESKLKQVYDGLSKKYPKWEAIGYDNFKKEMFPEKRKKEQTLQNRKINNLTLYNNLIDSKRITVAELGDFETFNALLSDQTKAIKLYEKLIKKGFNEDEIGNQVDFLANINQSSKTSQPNLSFQIDKIKVGETFIDLPIPSGFVKIDDSMGILLETVKKMCPKINTFLAAYLSETDYANFLASQNCTFDKFIIVEVSNDFKDKQVVSKDYRKLINSFKKEYIEEFKQILDKAGNDASENITKLYENLKMENFKTQPLGICFESKNSLSYGLLSKYTLTVENESSKGNIVAAIATITKIDKKPICLFSYKTYNNNEDINSLKEMNSLWIREIDRKQNPTSFIADIDFEDYKEAILAILTLSFIWAIYIATKKIQRKQKTITVLEKTEFEDKKEYIDFDDLLLHDGSTTNELLPEKQIAKEKLPNKIRLMHVKNIFGFFITGLIYFFIHDFNSFSKYNVAEFLGTMSVSTVILPMICIIISIIITVIRLRGLNNHWEKVYTTAWSIFIVLLLLILYGHFSIN